MISFQKVTKVYHPDITVLEDVSFDIAEGEFVSIVGKSGAGKTTLIKMMLGLETPTFGQVFYNGKNIDSLTSGELQTMRRSIGAIYQDYKLLPAKTVYENVAYVMEINSRENDEISRVVPQVLEIIGLKEKVYNFPHELSGGEQQRVAIARALVTNPTMILADEPTGNLDPYNAYEVLMLLEKINRTGKTVVLSTHDREIINKLAKRVITIEDGRLVRDEAKGRFII